MWQGARDASVPDRPHRLPSPSAHTSATRRPSAVASRVDGHCLSRDDQILGGPEPVVQQPVRNGVDLRVADLRGRHPALQLSDLLAGRATLRCCRSTVAWVWPTPWRDGACTRAAICPVRWCSRREPPPRPTPRSGNFRPTAACTVAMSRWARPAGCPDGLDQSVVRTGSTSRRRTADKRHYVNLLRG